MKPSKRLDKYIIRRQARTRRPLPQGDVKLPRPPSLPTRPSPTGGILQLLPSLLMALTMGGIMFVFSSGGTAINPMAMAARMVIPMSVMGTSTFFIQRHMFKKKVEEVEAEIQQKNGVYYGRLRKLKEELETYSQQQRDIMRQENPPLNVLVKRIENQGKGLWERQPPDDDFLALRIGLASQPVCVNITPLDSDDDDRVSRINRMAEEYSVVNELPVLVNLNKLGSVGIEGSRPSETLYATYAMLVNLITHHSPDEVYLYIFSHHQDAAHRWGWTRWLPHTDALHNSKETGFRLSFSPTTDDDVLTSLLAELRRREEQTQDRRISSRSQPHLVVLCDHVHDLLGTELIDKILMHDPRSDERNILKLSGLFIDSPIPPTVSATVQIREKQFVYHESWAADANHIRRQGTVDLATPRQIKVIARHIAPLRTEESFFAAGGGLPSSVRLVSLLGAKRADELDLTPHYTQKYDPARVMSFPIGTNVDAKPQMIALREKGQKGNGQHAILAGGTGAGKSVTLQSIVLSLALMHPPSYLNFVLADFKAGASELAKLKDLPHVVGFVTDLNSALVERFRLALDGEITRRKEVFAQTTGTQGKQVTNIYQYNKLCSNNPMPHLVIVIDEFHKGRQLNPDFQKTMDNGVAAQGRALGIHLLLSTQKAKDFGDVLPNIEIRMSMRMNSSEDSKEIFKRDDAFTRLTRPGQAFVQCMRNEQSVFEMFQAARADEPYVPVGEQKLLVNDRFVIEQVGVNGRRAKLYEHESDNKSVNQQSDTQHMLSEAEVLVQHVKQFCQGKFTKQPLICLPPLSPAYALPLLTLLTENVTYTAWQEDGWAETTNPASYLRVPIGMLDLPAQQKQRPYLLDLTQGDGNFLVVGPQGSGKTLFLRSLLLGLSLTHMPTDVHFYILSQGETLSIFEKIPHCGAVIRSIEEERVMRVLHFLRKEVNDRRTKMRTTHTASITELRQKQPDTPLPAVILVMENFASFKAEYEGLLPEIQYLAENAGGVDIHLVIGVTAISTISSHILTNLRNRLALGQKDYQETLNVRAQPVMGIEGRGYIVHEQQPIECQIAAPCEPLQIDEERLSAADMQAQQNASLRSVITRLTTVRVDEASLPQDIGMLPKHIQLTHLWKQAPLSEPVPFSLETAPIGLYYDDLSPITLDFRKLEPYFMVIGEPESGKTSFLVSLCLAAAKHISSSDLEIILFGFKRNHLMRLAPLPHIHILQNIEEDLQQLAADLEKRSSQYRQNEQQRLIHTGSLGISFPKKTVIIIDDLQDFLTRGGIEIFQLVDLCMQKGRDVETTIIVADTAFNMSQAKIRTYLNAADRNRLVSPQFAKTAVDMGNGLILSGEQLDRNLLQLDGRANLKDLLKKHAPTLGHGRAFFSYQNKPRLVQFATVADKHITEDQYKTTLDRLVAELAQTTKPSTPGNGQVITEFQQ